MHFDVSKTLGISETQNEISQAWKTSCFNNLSTLDSNIKYNLRCFHDISDVICNNGGMIVTKNIKTYIFLSLYYKTVNT